MIIEELLQGVKKIEVEGHWPAEGQGQAMSDERRSLGQRAKILAEAASDSHPVLGRDLEKIYTIRTRRHYGIEEVPAQTKAGAAKGAIEPNS
jgi:hypothetical protein